MFTKGCWAEAAVKDGEYIPLLSRDPRNSEAQANLVAHLYFSKSAMGARGNSAHVGYWAEIVELCYGFNLALKCETVFNLMVSHAGRLNELSLLLRIYVSNRFGDGVSATGLLTPKGLFNALVSNQVPVSDLSVYTSKRILYN
ncbi:hypothetical protein R1sor_024744 [Riccia sorocarpa]|uniref:Pentatricopeptide repeat-containing protein n=1 Tax=Riccia sorocarpa TaxID=122646 RepID=A0ABD3GS49_9MARC